MSDINLSSKPINDKSNTAPENSGSKERHVKKIEGVQGEGALITKARGRTARGESHDFFIGTPEPPQRYSREPNRTKIIDLCFASMDLKSFMTANMKEIIASLTEDVWNNWRCGKSMILQGDDSHKVNAAALPEVPKSVYPTLANYTIKEGINYSFLDIRESLKQGGGVILGNVRDFARKGREFGRAIKGAANMVQEIGRGKGESDSSYAQRLAAANSKDATMYDQTSKIENLGLLQAQDLKASEMQFDLGFNFGCGGFYSGEIEVVRPIMALVNCIAPQRINDNNHFIVTPGATPSQFYAAMWGATLGAGADVLKKVFSRETPEFLGKAKDAISNSGGVVGAIGEAGNQIAQLSESILEATLLASDAATAAAAEKTTFVFFRLGQYIGGPYQVSKANYTFDYNYVDEAGFPYKGNIAIDLVPVYKPMAEDLLLQAGYYY